MNHVFNKETLNQIVSLVIEKKNISGAVFCVSSNDNSVDLISAAGDIKEDSPYYIASINKLFISAIILKLFSENKLDIKDNISKYLSGEIIHGLHIYKNKDYSNFITISHLMSHTSGLPCYLADRQENNKTAMKELIRNIDQAWPIEKVIQEVKKMKKHFSPGTAKKAKYSDTNYRILSLIIEKVIGNPINITLNNLFQELGLKSTYVCEDVNDNNYVPIKYKSAIIHVPLFLSSTHDDIISTAKDQMLFLKTFFNGYFFPKERLGELENWNNIYFPFKYGIGIEKFYIPRILSPFNPMPDMIGKSGSTGAVAFYVPDIDIFITGTINNQASPNVAFQTMIKIISKLH